MKRISCILIIVLLAFGGCARSEKETPSGVQPIDIQKVELSNLRLSENQAFGVSDYYNNQLLLLVYDTKKRDPREEESMQAPEVYCVKFVLYDMFTQEIVEEFPIEQFGSCLSATYAYDGVLLTWVTYQNQDRKPDSSIHYINKQGTKRVYDLSITKFALGPLLYRCNGEVVFSYTNELTDGEYGVKKITSNLSVEPLLTFSPSQSDNMSDEIVVSKDRYVYAVGEEGQVTFYVGGTTQSPIKFSLPKGEKIYSFGLTEDWLIVSRHKTDSEGGGNCLERFDLKGNSVELYDVVQPVYFLTGASGNRFCGFNSYTPVELFEITDTIERVEYDTNAIDSTYTSGLTNGENFMITSYDKVIPGIWRVAFS